MVCEMQLELEAVRKDQKAVLARVALAIESSIQAGNKRAASGATPPLPKKPRCDTSFIYMKQLSNDEVLFFQRETRNGIIHRLLLLVV
jgi:hypothetical protein